MHSAETSHFSIHQGFITASKPYQALHTEGFTDLGEYYGQVAQHLHMVLVLLQTFGAISPELYCRLVVFPVVLKKKSILCIRVLQSLGREEGREGSRKGERKERQRRN